MQPRRQAPLAAGAEPPPFDVADPTRPQGSRGRFEGRAVGIYDDREIAVAGASRVHRDDAIRHQRQAVAQIPVREAHRPLDARHRQEEPPVDAAQQAVKQHLGKVRRGHDG